MTPRELVEKTFIELGYTEENPDDLDAVTELLEIWRTNKKVEYTPEQYALLNDQVVLDVLNKCKKYYEGKRILTKSDLREILQDIATGTLTRQDYDFKNGCPVTVEPSFGDRITAIKMLSDEASDNVKDTIQFINDIGDTDYEGVAEDGSDKEEA